MSDPEGRDDHPTSSFAAPGQPYTGDDGAPHGSTAFPGQPLPGQPLAEQRTDQLPPYRDPGPAGPDTVGLRAAQPRSEPERSPSFWDGDATEHHRDDELIGRADGGGRDGDGTAAAPVDPDATAPAWSDRPVAVRRPDTLAGLLLLLAGIAAGVSLLVVWVHGGGTGWDLVRSGWDDVQQGPDRLADTGTWQPLAVVAGGAVLFLLGLVLFAPARTHRFLGALGLVVTLVVAAGVLVPLADAHWRFDRFTTGFWFAVAVAGLGLLGSLKALVTGPKVR